MLSLSRSLLFPLFFVFFFSPSLCIVLNDEFLPARASTFSETFGRAAFRASKQKKAKAAALWCLGIIIFSFFLLFFCGPEKKKEKRKKSTRINNKPNRRRRRWQMGSRSGGVQCRSGAEQSVQTRKQEG